jgi:methyl-accepting chemotaxis protein
MSKEGKADRKGVGFFRSVSFRIIMVAFCSVVIAVVFCMAFIIPRAQSIVSDITQDYMLSMATAERARLDAVIGDTAGTTEQFASILENVKVEGVESSYAYLVSPDGTMLYHPTADKIGSPVENAVVTGLVAELKGGKVPADAVVGYEFKGVMKYAGYAITSQKQILVVTADEADVLAPIAEIQRIANIVVIFILALCLVFDYVFSTMIVKPLKLLTVIIEDTAAFDFKKSGSIDRICLKKDEIGVMGRAISDMRQKLRDIVGSIDLASRKIEDNVNSLQDVTNVVNSMCTDNSATTEQLAAGMQETAATAETIYGNIGIMQTGASDIGQLSVEGAKLSSEVMSRAISLRDTTMEASNRTKRIYDEVKVKSDGAIEGSKAVDKINELTEAIMAISSQTSLLALNASIEAARAGEAGRGFAVVATEIGNLAVQTSHAVTDINAIVGEVNMAVANMSECMEDAMRFIEKTVINDYNEFMEVGNQYNNDASQFEHSMNDIHESVENLTSSIATITDSLAGINATVGQSTVGVTDIAGKTTDMVGKTSHTYDLVSESLDYIRQLTEIVHQFKLN